MPARATRPRDVPSSPEGENDMLRSPRPIVATLIALLGASLLWVSARPSPVTAQGTFDWKRFNGKQIRFLVNSHDWTNEIIRPALPEFEQLTGIKVAWEIFPEDQFRQKLAVEMVSGSGSVDGVMFLTSWNGLRFLKAGWYEPIEKYVKNPALTSPQFLFEDFFPNTRQIATVNGQLIGVPLYPEVELLYYRKDVFKAKNVAVPQTMEEWEEAAKKLTGEQLLRFRIAGQALGRRLHPGTVHLQ